MKTITLRNIPHDISREIQNVAQKKQLSYTRAAIQILQKALGISSSSPKSVLHHDLDHFAGSWSSEQGHDFDSSLQEQRRIDRSLWS